ncbi:MULTISPECIES: sodium:solute symporter family protein [Oceanobacillus]|uniref:Cation acetate symporter n=1 Tax=Oceanobacillus kimchii TaxID=746691 RepID=A0ABQ5TIV7_9BACI|nr:MULTISPECIES: sodium:solute symporter family protein [Oceanobacillus]MBT2598627.1 cation acetate symporter [Oceanobacillus sp. ISL-74]MBT2651546.1 cation acetate symporter [Oceanobacillus sp. ISL-73]MCT1576195.1 cation acetate symporter [Oceanobacillus kimchii]MCT2135832.1 cation acetate symporter [Oceanobacillus kimchii]OEH54741.1 cation acetate symporter [Oceanobacillus sp. E9]
MSVEAITIALVLFTFLVYTAIGWWSRVRDTSSFYVAGQNVPTVANGAAIAADWMSAASFISMAGLVAFLGYDGTIYLMGWTGGYVLLALLLAPYLRKFGKFTVPDFIGDRFYSNSARAVAAIATIFISLTYISGQMRGVGIVFSRYLQVDIIVGVLIGMAIVGFFSLLGGMKGVTWTQAVQYFVIIIAFLIPAIAISFQLTGNPIPQISLIGSDIVERLGQIQIDLGMNEYMEPFTNLSLLNVFMITLALMAGTAGLPHVIVRFYTVKSVRSARWSAVWAIVFIALLYLTAPAVGAFAKYNLINTIADEPLEEVQDIEWVNKWETTGLLQFNDLDGDGMINFTSGPDNEVVIDGDIIVLSTPEVANLAPFVIALVAAGGLAAALSTASGLLITMTSAVSHDIYYRIFNQEASEKQRLRVGRITLFVALLIAAYVGIRPPGFAGEVVALAFGLGAASLFPVILTGIFDKRMNKEGAIAGILTGLTFTLITIGLILSESIFGTDGPIIENFFGINAQGVGVIGMLLNFVVSFIVSRNTQAPPIEIQQLIENVRAPEIDEEEIAATKDDK